MNSSFSLSSVLLFTPAIKRSFLNVILSYNHIIIVICIFVDYGHCDNPDSSHHIHPWSCWAAHFRASSMGECATQLNGFSLFSDVGALLQFCTGYFILKIDQFLRTVPLTDFLPGSISSVELRCSCCARSLEISAERSGETLPWRFLKHEQRLQRQGSAQVAALELSRFALSRYKSEYGNMTWKYCQITKNTELKPQLIF